MDETHKPLSSSSAPPEAPRVSEEYYRLAFASAAIGMTILDLEGRLCEVNEAFCRITGYSREELLQRDTIRITHPDDVAESLRQMRRLIAGEVSHYHLEKRYIRKSGESTWVRISVSLARDGAGKATCLLGLVEDFSETKRAREALRVSEERYRHLIESASGGVWALDAEMRICFVSSQMTHLLGYSEEEMLGRPAYEFMDQEAPPEGGSELESRIQAADEPCAFRFRRKDGTDLWAIVASNPIYDESGQFGGSFAMVTDITDRRRAEEDLSRMNSALRQLSGHLLRLRDEEHRRLAHELHESTAQNLAGVSLNLSLLQNSQGQHDPRENGGVSDALALLGQCMRDIRSLSYVLHPPLLEEAGLAAVLPGYMEEFSQRTGVVVSLELPPELGRLGQEVETTLFRIMQEALENVNRHAGSPSAMVRIERTDEQVALEVEDQGHGIPPALLEGGGIPRVDPGLGIMQMRERARQFGGQLTIRSGPQGTLLRVSLPISPVSPA